MGKKAASPQLGTTLFEKLKSSTKKNGTQQCFSHQCVGSVQKTRPWNWDIWGETVSA